MIPRVADKPENRDVATLSHFFVFCFLCLCLWPFGSKIMYHLKAASAVPRIGMYRPFLSLVSREQPATAVTIITGCLFYIGPPFYDATAVTTITWCLFYIGPPDYDATAVTIITWCLFYWPPLLL